jgi:hypothetical protein
VSLGSGESVSPVRNPHDDSAGHPSVRVIPRPRDDGTRDGRMTGDRDSSFPISVRPARVEDVRGVADHLRERRRVVLELERLEGHALRRRALDVATGIAYGLETSMVRVNGRLDAFLLDPAPRTPVRHMPVGPERDGADHDEVPASEVRRSVPCVLCDVRPADHAYVPPLDMVIRRDGSRVHSPAAPVCSHCRDTIRHWRFALGWCPKCERWGRRGVRSACGIPYGV